MNKYRYIGPTTYNYIYTKSMIPIATNFVRIVHSGRGAYVEFERDEIFRVALRVPDSGLWRVKSLVAYYIEYRTEDGVKVYFQRRTVDYADYKVGYYYISPVDLHNFEKTGERYNMYDKGANDGVQLCKKLSQLPDSR